MAAAGASPEDIGTEQVTDARNYRSSKGGSDMDNMLRIYRCVHVKIKKKYMIKERHI